MSDKKSEIILSEKMKAISEQLSDFINEARNSLLEMCKNMPEGLPEAYEKLHSLQKTVIMKLHSLGWYAYWPFEWGITDVINLHNNMSIGDIESVDTFMCNYIKDSLTTIQKNLSERYPDRYRILKLAFAAHDNGEYALSIPVFLAQAEGISVDILGEKLFSKENGVPKTSAAVSKIDAEMRDVFFLEPLKTLGPMIAGNKDKDKFMAWFNRHEVLHGVVTDYDTELNSYKSIALLKYLSGFVFRVKYQEVN